MAVDMTVTMANISIFVGIFIYINGMVKDMKMRLSAANLDSVGDSSSINIWTIYEQELNLHNEIIK